MAPHLPLPCFPLLFLLFLQNSVTAQSPPIETTTTTTTTTTTNNNINNPPLNPSLAIIIVLLLSFFLVIGFLSIYIRHCNDNHDVTSRTANISAAARIRIPRGLHPDVLQKLPTLVYSEVKHHKIGKAELECAICINEFDDDETIRILPVCDHVFHVDCIDAWLASHVTCPVCRANYVNYSPDVKVTAPAEVAVALPPDAPPARDIDEMRELARIASKVRGKSDRNFSRSHSAGNLAREGEGGFDRYTLRLPENLRREIFAAGKMRRAKTFAAAANVGGGELGGIRRGRSIYLGRLDRRPSFFGRSDRRPSFFGRSMSLRIPTFGNWRRGEEVYVKENSMNKKFGGGGGGGGGGKGYSDEASTAALNRMV